MSYKYDIKMKQPKEIIIRLGIDANGEVQKYFRDRLCTI